MKNTKYTLLIFLLIASQILMACGQEAAPQEAAPQEAAPQEAASQEAASQEVVGKTVVRQWEYSADPNAIEVIKQMVEDFNQQSETIEVRLELVPRDVVRQKLLASIEAGNPPDLVRFDLPWTPEFASSGYLTDLTDKIEEWGQIDDFYEDRLSTTIYEGKYYGLPSNSNNLALFYNKAMVEKAGITEGPKDWAQLKEYANKLVVTNGGAIDVAGLLFGAKKNETIPFDWFPWLWQAGGDVSNINNAAGVRALSEWVSYIDEDITPEGVLSWGHTEMRQQFEAGKAAMMINGTGYAAQLKKNAPDLEFGIWLLPCEDECASVIGGEDWVMPKGAEATDAAWEVLKYYSNSDIHEWWCVSTNTIPSIKSVGEATIFSEDPILSVFVEQMAVARPRPVHPRYPEVSEAVQIAVQSALTHQQTPQEALDDAQKIISDIFK